MSIPESELSYGSILTLTGENAEINGKLNNKPINFTHIAIGDANDVYVQPSRTQTTLVNEITRIPVTGMEKITPSEPDGVPQLKVWAKIPDNIVDIAVREFAAVATFDGNSYLHAVGNTVRIPILSGSNNGGEVNDIFIEMTFAVTSLEPIVMIDPAIVTATRKFVEEEDAKHINHPHPHPQYSLKLDTDIDLSKLRTDNFVGYQVNVGGSEDEWIPLVLSLSGICEFFIQSPTSSSIDPLNWNMVKGLTVNGGWSDIRDIADVFKSHYDDNENAFSAIYFGGTDSRSIVIYVRGGNQYNVLLSQGYVPVAYPDGFTHNSSKYPVFDLDGSVIRGETSNIEKSIDFGVNGDWTRSEKGHYYRGDRSFVTPVRSRALYEGLHRVFSNNNIAEALLAICPAGVPLPWPSSTPPTGYLQCRGQAFDKSAYPELAKAYPSGVIDDLRAEFIRGWDGGRGIDPDREILSSQGDAIRNIQGQMSTNINLGDDSANTGAFYIKNSDTEFDVQRLGTGSYNGDRWFDASRVVPVAEENRPRNKAYMYIVRAA
ncbi:phage tail protein [Vibrio sp. Isolate25]|uniref:phage tail protein n=1 Tax=Vibrio sp. Isolate25 TaxID=2908535 RepID=UPI001EFDEA85|nr:phage tail protein [Vibrio sp. Isolate25]MCG9597052.1 phage tail protein [Vibrio sp. Isolate25]